jgi:flavin reductase (DIM6/NTAB) family NADH-FMN oxidoreductase RutF
VSATFRAGSESGRQHEDRFARAGLGTFEASTIGAPLVAGCVAWLECRLRREPHNEERYDLFIGEVTAAWADSRVFAAGRWCFAPEHDALRTLHHVAGGAFFSPADLLLAKP